MPALMLSKLVDDKHKTWPACILCHAALVVCLSPLVQLLRFRALSCLICMESTERTRKYVRPGNKCVDEGKNTFLFSQPLQSSTHTHTHPSWAAGATNQSINQSIPDLGYSPLLTGLCVTHKQTDELFNVLTVASCLQELEIRCFMQEQVASSELRVQFTSWCCKIVV